MLPFPQRLRSSTKLKSEGIDKNELGREGFLKRTWEWREEYGRTIVRSAEEDGLLLPTGTESASPWTRAAPRPYRKYSCSLHKKGYIYKGSRIINWCPVCKTSISDAEVEHEEQAGHFWHINYPINGRATSSWRSLPPDRRPCLATRALAVNPDDERYKDIVGKTVILPLVRPRDSGHRGRIRR